MLIILGLMLVVLLLAVLYLTAVRLIRKWGKRRRSVEIKNLRYKTLNRPKDLVIWDGIREEPEIVDIENRFRGSGDNG